MFRKIEPDERLALVLRTLLEAGRDKLAVIGINLSQEERQEAG